MANVHCLRCMEPWELYHMVNDEVRSVMYEYGLWPDISRWLEEPSKMVRGVTNQARAEKALATRWYAIVSGKKKMPNAVAYHFGRAGWQFVNGNVARIIACPCCDDADKPPPVLPDALVRQLAAFTGTGRGVDGTASEDRAAVAMVKAWYEDKDADTGKTLLSPVQGNTELNLELRSYCAKYIRRVVVVEEQLRPVYHVDDVEQLRFLRAFISVEWCIAHPGVVEHRGAISECVDAVWSLRQDLPHDDWSLPAIRAAGIRVIVVGDAKTARDYILGIRRPDGEREMQSVFGTLLDGG